MALVRLRAVTIVNAATIEGTLKTYHPGDWFEVGKQKAIELIENKQAEIPQEAEAQRALTDDLSDCGIYLRQGSDTREAKEALGGLKLEIIEWSGAMRLPFERTLIWSTRQSLQRRQIALGFARVEDTGRYSSWEVAAMLRENELLALNVGERDELRKTREATYVYPSTRHKPCGCARRRQARRLSGRGAGNYKSRAVRNIRFCAPSTQTASCSVVCPPAG